MNGPQAQISAFTNKKFAGRFNDMIEQHLYVAGAEGLTAKYRGGQSLVEKEGCAFFAKRFKVQSTKSKTT